MVEVKKLEERVREAEQGLAEVATITKFHGRELRNVRQHLNSMDDHKITPIQAQVADIHKYISREKGFHEGHAHFSSASAKRIGMLIGAGGLALGILTLMVKTL